jgi:hypothetical protein
MSRKRKPSTTPKRKSSPPKKRRLLDNLPLFSEDQCQPLNDEKKGGTTPWRTRRKKSSRIDDLGGDLGGDFVDVVVDGDFVNGDFVDGDFVDESDTDNSGFSDFEETKEEEEKTYKIHRQPKHKTFRKQTRIQNLNALEVAIKSHVHTPDEAAFVVTKALDVCILKEKICKRIIKALGRKHGIDVCFN